MLEWFILFLSIVNLILVCLAYKNFTMITNNQETVIMQLNDDIQRLRDDGK